MSNEERDVLLIRLDERTQHISEWIPKHEKEHQEQRASVQKWLGIFAAAIAGAIARVIFWK